jgi:hypothetical protein
MVSRKNINGNMCSGRRLERRVDTTFSFKNIDNRVSILICLFYEFEVAGSEIMTI